MNLINAEYKDFGILLDNGYMNMSCWSELYVDMLLLK